ncbi:glycosyltransferase family 2 protein [Spirosoma aerophilum]
MATYNGSKYVIRQIDSIIDQLGVDDEIVVSDDNSTDDTYDVILAMNDKRIKIVKNNILYKGPLANFENALKHAKGEYIFLSDQDDIWASNKIEIMTQKLEFYDLVLSDCEVVDESINVIIPSFFDFRHSRSGIFRNLYKNSYIGCCMAFRREVLKYALPFPASIHMHDWWIGLLVEARGNVCFVHQPLMKYVRHGNNASPTGEVSSYTVSEQVRTRLLLSWHLFKRCFRCL